MRDTETQCHLTCNESKTFLELRGQTFTNPSRATSAKVDLTPTITADQTKGSQAKEIQNPILG
eukprot:6104732-Amphidinium_carterae.1